MIFVGVDGGLSGAICVINENGNILLKQVMPVIKAADSRTEYDIPAIKKIFEELKSTNINLIVGLEKSQVTPAISKNSAYSLGYCNGLFQGILTTLNIPYKLIRAQAWQKEILAGINGENSKQRSIIFCKRRFPQEDWKTSARCKNDNDGLTDAACLALYLKLKEGK